MAERPASNEERNTLVHAGLCARCVHVAVVKSDRGSVFVMCEMSRQDARFPRYPRLPVVECVGYREERSG